jgi:hypothetical protein
MAKQANVDACIFRRILFEALDISVRGDIVGICAAEAAGCCQPGLFS